MSNGTLGKQIQPRSEDKFPRPIPIDEAELANPKILTVLRLVYNTIVRVFHDPVGMIIGSGFILIMLWGTHGKLDIVGALWDGWRPFSDPASRGTIISGLPWDQEWIAFFAGSVLLVLVPCILIKLVFKQDLADYGLGLPPKGRVRLALLSAGILMAVSLPAFYLGTNDAGMQATYPFYRGEFEGIGAFALYSLGALAFYVNIEFIFRGYLLFGLFQFKDRDAPDGVVGVKGPLVFGYYAIFISMLSYTAWHLGKPLPELWGTLIWGVAAGTIVLASRSIGPIIAVHWLMNVLLDFVLWQKSLGG